MNQPVRNYSYKPVQHYDYQYALVGNGQETWKWRPHGAVTWAHHATGVMRPGGRERSAVDGIEIRPWGYPGQGRRMGR